jgi:hypothetical protein
MIPASRAPDDHAPRVLAAHAFLTELPAAAAAQSAEQGRRLVRADAGGGDVGVDIGFQQVVGRHLVLLAAFLVQPHPPAFALRVVVLDVYVQRSRDPGECILTGCEFQAPQKCLRLISVYAINFMP